MYASDLFNTTTESPSSAAPPPAAPAPAQERTGEDRTIQECVGGEKTGLDVTRREWKRRYSARQYNGIGFTNKMCIGLVFIMFVGLCMGFALAVYSVKEQYTGALECFTIAFTPMGVGINIVLTRAVVKSDHENTSAEGEGIKYGKAREEWYGDN